MTTFKTEQIEGREARCMRWSEEVYSRSYTGRRPRTTRTRWFAYIGDSTVAAPTKADLRAALRAINEGRDPRAAVKRGLTISGGDLVLQICGEDEVVAIRDSRDRRYGVPSRVYSMTIRALRAAQNELGDEFGQLWYTATVAVGEDADVHHRIALQREREFIPSLEELRELL